MTGRDTIKRFARAVNRRSVTVWSTIRGIGVEHWHKLPRIGLVLWKIVLWGGFGTLAGLAAAFLAFIVELEDRQSERIFRAWEVAIAASDSAGTRGVSVAGAQLYETDTSARQALEFLNRDFSGWICGSVVGFVSDLTTGNSRRTCVFPSKRRESFKGMRLSRMNLKGVWLPRAELTFGRLDQVNLEGANLQRAILQHAVLTRARLGGADLRRSRLQGADLSRSILVGTELQGADMRSNVTLNGVRMYTNLLGVSGLTCSQLEKANGWEQSFRDSDLACGEEIPDHRRVGFEHPVN